MATTTTPPAQILKDQRQGGQRSLETERENLYRRRPGSAIRPINKNIGAIPAAEYLTPSEKADTDAKETRQLVASLVGEQAAEERLLAEYQRQSQYAEALVRLRKSVETEKRAKSEEESAMNAEERVSTGPHVNLAHWVLLFSATGITTLVTWILSFFIPMLPLALDILVACGIRFWAKSHELKLPTGFSQLRSAGAIMKFIPGLNGIGKTAEASGTVANKIGENVPGSDLLLILFSGVTPLLYAFFLWLDNRQPA